MNASTAAAAGPNAPADTSRSSQSTVATARIEYLRGATSDYVQVILVVLLVLIAVILGSLNEFVGRTVAVLLIWVMMAQGWNILSGYAGPLSLGQAAFLGLTAWTMLALWRDYNVNPYIGGLIGLALSLLVALIVGGIALRRPSFFFSISSLLVPFILQALAQVMGYYDVVRPYSAKADVSTFSFPGITVYMWISGALVICFAIYTWIMSHRQFGRCLVAIRENKRAAESAGVPTYRYKLTAYLVAAAFASVAGFMYAEVNFVFDPSDAFDPSVSAMAYLIPMFGGQGTVVGPVLGGVIVIPVQQFFRLYLQLGPGVDWILFACVLIVVAMRFPAGLYPGLVRLASSIRARIARKRARPAAEAMQAVAEDQDGVE
jgi:branched-chain amino acid transport system permease protein